MLYVYAVIFGLLIGSFLSVVVSRLPKMLHCRWEAECRNFLTPTDSSTSTPSEKFNLNTPRSHCPNCKAMVKWWQNFPVISYILLRGKCHNCHTHISLFYPAIELSTMIATIWLTSHFGLTPQLFFALIFTYSLIALSCIDWRTTLLPDEITLPVMWIGLMISTQFIFVSPQDAIIGAAAGYLSLWIIANLYKLIRKQDGMGYGDLKLLALLGAWVGPYSLINILFIACILGLIVAVILMMRKKITGTQPMPFGPYLAIAGWLTFMYGPFILKLIYA